MKTKILTVLEQIWTNMRSPIDVRTTVQEARPGGLLLPHITWVVLSMFHYLSRRAGPGRSSRGGCFILWRLLGLPKSLGEACWNSRQEKCP